MQIAPRWPTSASGQGTLVGGKAAKAEPTVPLSWTVGFAPMEPLWVAAPVTPSGAAGEESFPTRTGATRDRAEP